MKGYFLMLAVVVVSMALMLLLGGCASTHTRYEYGNKYGSTDPTSPVYISKATRKAIPACVWNGDCRDTRLAGIERVKFSDFSEVK